jgi:hypothetical protein
VKKKSKVAIEIARRKAAGMCTAMNCDRTPRKKADGSKYAYCEHHRRENKKRADEYYARLAAKKTRKAARKQPKPVARVVPISKTTEEPKQVPVAAAGK